MLIGGVVVLHLLDKDDDQGARGGGTSDGKGSTTGPDEDDDNDPGPDEDEDEDQDDPDPDEDEDDDEDYDTDHDDNGVIDAGYLGAWAGEVLDRDGDPTGTFRRVEIYQGYVGDTIAETWNLETDFMCRGTADLVSFGRLMTIESEMTDSVGASCSAYGEQTLRLQDDGTVVWSYPDYDYTAVLEQSNHEIGEDAVPKDYLDSWVPWLDDSGDVLLTIHQGPEGAAVATWEHDSPVYTCTGGKEWTITETWQDGRRLGAGGGTTGNPKWAGWEGEGKWWWPAVAGDTRM